MILRSECLFHDMTQCLGAFYLFFSMPQYYLFYINEKDRVCLLCFVFSRNEYEPVQKERRANEKVLILTRERRTMREKEDCGNTPETRVLDTGLRNGGTYSVSEEAG